jgi:hypothetical protein
LRLKFDDCVTCRFRRKPRICTDCDVGELYEDEDAPTVDLAFHEPATRFGDTLPDDDETPGFDPSRFLDSLDERNDPEDSDS